MTLTHDLVAPLTSLASAGRLALDSLTYAAALPASDAQAPPYVIRTVTVGGRPRTVRPINAESFVPDPAAFERCFAELCDLLGELRAGKGSLADGRAADVRSARLITRALYTLTQAIGIGMDCLLEPNTARKNFGSRLEETVKALFHELGCGTKDLTLALPYSQDARFRNQIDLVLSEAPPVRTTRTKIDPDEVIVSIKSSSKDRMGKVFLDKEVLRFITKTDLPVIALFHNDVQRRGADGIGGTFVAGNFLAYVAAFGPLNGVYYVDPPKAASKPPWSSYIKTFEDLLLDDLWSIVF